MERCFFTIFKVNSGIDGSLVAFFPVVSPSCTPSDALCRDTRFHRGHTVGHICLSIAGALSTSYPRRRNRKTFIVRTKFVKPAHLGYPLLCPTFSSSWQHEHWNSPDKKVMKIMKMFTFDWERLIKLILGTAWAISKMEKTDGATCK